MTAPSGRPVSGLDQRSIKLRMPIGQTINCVSAGFADDVFASRDVGANLADDEVFLMECPLGVCLTEGRAEFALADELESAFVPDSIHNHEIDMILHSSYRR